MAKCSNRRALRRVLVVACATLAPVPVAFAAAPDPFAPLPVAEGEASDPRIEAWRESLRPGTFAPRHDVRVDDELYFKHKRFKAFVKACDGDPGALILVPKEGTPATPFRMRFENPAAQIREYIGLGYACTLPAKMDRVGLTPVRAPVPGLVTFSDGSYWLGEVSGALEPASLESLWIIGGMPLTPTPAGLGEWGRADGTRIQGEARVLSVPMWPKGWGSTSVVGFEMTTIRRAALPDGRLLAGNLRLDNGVVVEAAPSAVAMPAPAVAVAPAAAAAPPAARPDAAIHSVQAGIAPAAIPAPVPAAGPSMAGSIAATGTSHPVGPIPAATDGRAGELAARIEAWRVALAPDRLASARSSVASGALSKSREFNSYVQACGGGAPTPFRLGFANADAPMRSYTGYATGCTFPAQPSEQVVGIIEYADGSRWLGQVSAMPQAAAIELGTFGGLPPPVHTLVPAPHGAGEWTWPDGTRVQGLATPLQPKFLFRDTWTQAPLGAFAMTEVMQLVTPDGVAYVGAIQLSEQGFSAEQATARWRDGRVFTGRVDRSMPSLGVMAYPDGGRVKGTVVRGEDGVARWQEGAALDLSIATPAGPPGRYVFFGPLRFDTPTQASLEVAGARPIDAATLARAGRNTRQCAQPPAVPAGWVVWWPSCQAGPAGRVAMYSADAQQMLLFLPGGGPKRHVLVRGTEPGRYGGIEIRADAFTREAQPNPVGEGELYLWGVLEFNGSFVAQQPTIGRCVVPANEGGGWEPCQYVGWQRVDEMHQLRQERLELARQEEELRREMERQANAERYAEEEREYEREQAELREQSRRDEIAGRLAIAEAIRGAAYDIGMAYADREAARDAADYREREAAREAERAAYRPAASYGGDGSSGGSANERAAQLAARQAELERRQAELRQRQARADAPRPAAPAPLSPSSDGVPSHQGSGGGTESYDFTIADHNVGRVSATRQILGLAVTLEIRRVGLRISGADRSEICANFENRTAANWSGGYRLTDRDARDTHASMSVPAGGTARKCETLNPQAGYTVVLRQDRR